MKKVDLTLALTHQQLENHLSSVASTDDIFQSINNVVYQCTNKNIQTCRNLLTSLLSSRGFDLLIKYLCALSETMVHKRKRIYLLYLVHDIIHDMNRSGIDHHHYWSDPKLILPLFSIAWEHPPNRLKLNELVEIWNEQHIFSSLEMFGEATYNPSQPTLSLPTILEHYISQYKNKPPLYTMPASFSLSNQNYTLSPSSLEIKDVVNKFHNSNTTKPAFKEEETAYTDTHTYNGWSTEFESTNSITISHNEISPLITRQQMISENGTPFNAFKPPDFY